MSCYRDIPDDPDDLPGNFENAMQEADAASDRRFGKAEVAGRLVELASRYR